MTTQAAAEQAKTEADMTDAEREKMYIPTRTRTRTRTRARTPTRTPTPIPTRTPPISPSPSPNQVLPADQRGEQEAARRRQVGPQKEKEVGSYTVGRSPPVSTVHTEHIYAIFPLPCTVLVTIIFLL